MGDALCGPSNPLQNFRKQTQLDRTLQQDRLIQPRTSGAQGFRSYDPRTGSLDADLHAFEHGGPNPALLQLQQPHPSQAAFSPAAAGWAADFQKLQISHPSTPVSIATPPQPQLAGWGSEFVMHNQNQRVGTPMSDVKGKQVMPEPVVQGNMFNTAAYYDSPYQQQMQMPNYSMYQQPSHQQQHPIIDQTQTDFEAAFAEALASAQAEVTAQEQEQSEQNLYNANGVEMEYPPQSHAPIGSDAINYVEQSDRTIDQDVRDADELARTAGQLLDMVKNDSSEKMKNSQFLNLMRQLRDREVEVQNNDLKSTDKTKDRVYMENETDVNPLSLNMQDVQLRQGQGQGQEVDADVDMESAQSQSQATQNPHADTSTDTATDRSFQPTRDSFDFQFPDMNTVYAQQSLPASGTNTPRNRFAGSWDYPITSNLSAGIARPSSVPPTASAFVADGMLRGDVGGDTEMNMYSSHDDEYPNASTGAPQSQIQALHPGGRWYPEQKSPTSPDLTHNSADVINAANHHTASDGGAEDVMSGAVNTPTTSDYPNTPSVNIGTGLMGTGLMGQSGISMSAD